MKHLFYIPLFLILVSAASAEVSAQDYTPVPVTISKEKVRMDGKVYYSHIVLERQTLYSICKAYNVTMEQIYEVNPSVKEEGLKKNAIILIPATGEKGQIAEPVQVITETPAADTARQPVEGEDYIIHVVKWYEDLDAISEKYNVSVEEIKTANGLKGRKLKRRQQLRIPLTKSGIAGVEHGSDSTAVSDSVAQEAVSGPAIAAIGRNEVNAILLLPFNAGAEKPRSGSIDFYCGALMAVKQSGDKGMDIELSVYDVEDGTVPVTDERFKESDIVIGPVSASALARLLSGCPAGTKVVSPLDHKAEYLAEGHPGFIQVPASTLSLYGDLAGWIKEDLKVPDEKVIVIYEKGSRNIEELGAMNTILEKDGIPFSTFSYSILEGRDVQTPLMEMMTDKAVNRVLVMSESEAFVNDVVRNLNLIIHEEYDVVLYASSKIRGFETIEVDNLHNTRLHTSLSYYIDYENADVKDFVKKYRALYNTEPTPFAFQGYDIATFFFQLCADYGKDWERHLCSSARSMLQADFRFMKEGEDDGFVNTGVRRIVYGPDYSVTLE